MQGEGERRVLGMVWPTVLQAAESRGKVLRRGHWIYE